MTSSRLQASRVVVLFMVGVSAVVMLMYLHLAKEVCHLRNYIHSHPAMELQMSGTLTESSSSSSNSRSSSNNNGKRKDKKNGGHTISSINGRGLDLESLIVIYNRVPKTGSTSFIGLAYDLCSKNKFNVINVNTTKKNPTLSLTDQMRLVYNMSNWEEKKPGIYHGHLAYLDFNRFGVNVQPLYINIIRNPLERLVSHYYFIRYGDDLMPQRVYKKMGDKMTLDECVALQHPDCSTNHLWMQIPFFCGHYAECWIPGSSWALEMAKHNLVQNYFLVGVTEELEDFVAMLEYSLPRLFKGALDLYVSGSKSHIRKTSKKIMPSDETITKLQNTKVWRLENEFYNFALDHFHFLRKKTLVEAGHGGVLVDRGQNFVYGKIKPKKRRSRADHLRQRRTMQ
ncbi:heparan sulfate 2-O-sulfotransferase 1-like [Homarus americanus]|uniref:heparan sulfate 2-O-sulfotransferase 1-like n=1 Tax=Homarus americanus TaxID=6706 RepID=UPI001C45C0C1|nr:heparan sulfate 2-O-sulfotransferase 1-like [Homarus americanus]XP_042230902.1 heparan sulfate 2-O-sulfotransferase 1-like [Homarus americanus]XP_042230988.1 heparan sulfate 2-O-sulfotransferase 1-like [Homarus americanus]